MVIVWCYYLIEMVKLYFLVVSLFYVNKNQQNNGQGGINYDYIVNRQILVQVLVEVQIGIVSMF